MSVELRPLSRASSMRCDLGASRPKRKERSSALGSALGEQRGRLRAE